MAEKSDPWAAFPDAKPEPRQESATSGWDQFPDAKPQASGAVSSFAAPAALAEGAAEPAKDTRSWTEWARDTVMGRHDPAYQGLPTFDEAMQEENKGKFLASPEIRQIRMGAMTAGDDAAYGDIMKASIGDRFIRKERDKYGYDIVVYKGPDGSEKKAYVNRPGLDTEDVGRGLANAIPYVATGVAAAYTGGAAPIVARGLLQGATQFGTSLGLDAASRTLGSEQDLDLARAGVAGVAGVAGEFAAPAVQAAWRRLVTIPGLFDGKAGALTPKGYQIAIDAGLDPSTFTKDMAKKFATEYATSADAAIAGRQFATHDLGIESTVGQRSKNASDLLEEMAMRKGVKGTEAERIINEFDKKQRQQIVNAALGDVENAGAGNIPGSKGIGASLNPAREVKDMVPVELGAGIKDGLTTAQRAARDAERQAWQGLHNVTAHPDAMKLLPQVVGAELGDRAVDQTVTPSAYNMAKMLQSYMTGDAMKQPFEVLGQTAPTPTVDAMRRRLGRGVAAATTPEDRSVAGKLYDGFNNWIKEAADAQLLAGHPDAAAALYNARSVSKEIKDLFQPRDAAGRSTPARGIIEKVMQKEDTPEGIVRSIVGNPASNVKTGTVEALQKMQKALTKFGGSDGVNAWNDIRSAYYLKMITDPKGELMSPTVMLNTIKKTFEKQPTVLKTLFSPAEIGEIKKLQTALEQITYKDPNPSGSGYAVANFAKQFIMTILDTIPGMHKITVPIKIAANVTGIPQAIQQTTGRSAARAATNQAIPATAPPALGPQTSLLAQQYLRMREPERRDQ